MNSESPTKKKNNKIKTFAEIFALGAKGGVVRAHWETIDPSLQTDSMTPSPVSYGLLGGTISVVLVLGFLDMAYMSWQRRWGVCLAIGLFFKTGLSAAAYQVQLAIEQDKTEQAITQLAEVSIASDSSVSQQESIEFLEDYALEESNLNSQSAAISGIEEVSEASKDIEVKVKAVNSLVKIGLEAETLEEKNIAIQSLTVLKQATKIKWLSAKIQAGIEDIEADSMALNNGEGD